MNDLLATLNPQQREAVTTTDGALLILAGAGSGKTRVITVRIAYLISEKQVAPYNILAVTFTNKAAGEMRQRVENLLRGERLNSAPLVTTFHSLCVRILRQHIGALKQSCTKSFTIYDQDDAVRLTKQCIRDCGYDDKQLQPRATQSAISATKNRGEDADIYARRVEYGDDKRAAIARVFRLYEERLANNNALDFDDLLIRTVQLLRTAPEVRAYYNDKFKYILVDEYQDTNSLQFALIRYLTEKQQNICVVGDESQSIYKFRGADIANILSFEEHYPHAKIIRLEQNYRSTQNILDAADSVIKNNTERRDKKLWTENTRGTPLYYYQAFDGDAEARFVAAKIQDYLRRDPDTRAAILYRTNSQSRVFEEALRRASLRYNIVGGFSFYERMEVRDVISYLKLALNPHDSIALLRVINTPPRGIGKTTLDEIERRAKDFSVSHWETLSIIIDQPEKLTPRAVNALKSFREVITNLVESVQRAAATEEPVSEVVKAAIQDTGYANALKNENTDEAEARLANLEELVNAAVDYDKQGAGGLRDFIDHAALASDSDQYQESAQITLMTAHGAKGLEFPIVFIVGLEDGLFPHARSLGDKTELEEERRLMYVAITRAEKYLYLSHAMKRRVYGDEMMAEPSQFLNELPLQLIEDLSRGASWLSFARSDDRTENKRALNALTGANSGSGKPQSPRETNYTGKTYDSADSIAEFFRKRGQSLGDDKPRTSSGASASNERTSSGGSNYGKRPPSNYSSRPTDAIPPRLTPAPKIIRAADSAKSSGGSSADEGFVPGSYVRHSKYGRGLVLRREGSGGDAKLTVSFPGYGQKKLIEKYAGLEKD